MAKLSSDILMAMHKAVSDGDLNGMVQLLDQHPSLLRRRKMVDGMASSSWLHLAALFSRHELAKPLVERGLDVNIQDRKGQIPLQTAVAGKYLPVVRALLDCGANVHVVNSFNEPLLYLIAQNSSAFDESSVSMAKELIARGCEVDRVTYGETALMQAAKRNRTDLVRVLLQGGANPAFRSPKDGKSVLDVASEYYEDETLELLKTWIQADAARRAINDVDGADLRPLAYVLPN